MSQKTVDSQFKTYVIKNLTSNPFVHYYNGARIVIGSKKQITLPAAAAKDVAYHLAQRVLDEKGLPFFGQEHDDEIANILGEKVVKTEFVEENANAVIEGEYAGEDVAEEAPKVVAPKPAKKSAKSKPVVEEEVEQAEETEEATNEGQADE